MKFSILWLIGFLVPCFNVMESSKGEELKGQQVLEGVIRSKNDTNLPGLVPIYQPTITLTTKNLGEKSEVGWIEIRVRDNGPGIPPNILDKIFQPFFTTKPTGQGTGLGLTLAYDIVKKHGGTITVNSFNSPKGGPPGGSIDVISNYHEPGVIPIAIGTIGRKVETATAKEGEGSEFIIIINELKNERIKEPTTRNENFQTEVIQNIEENSLKINQHGKRADAIVKGMLQHSQKQTGVRACTDINALADEYLRLAYHTYQSKEKMPVEINLITQFDTNLPLINVMPQDIGRVLVNLFNNAFWACKVKSEGVTSKSPLHFSNYTPAITVTTKSLDDSEARLATGSSEVELAAKNLSHGSPPHSIEIRICDNGPGIPPHFIDKIFQPFFTTKPTGQGTGLGLSLAYDIIEAHQGDLKVENVEGGGACFIIRLPGAEAGSVH